MDTYKVIVYHTSGVNQGNKDFELFCPDLETARQRRKFYVDEAIKLITEAGTLAADRDFISLYTTNDEMTNKLLKAFDIIPSMIFVIVIGPIFEELVFRKVLIDRLSIYGDRLALIVSSVAFGLHHGNLTQFIYTTMAGIIFGHIYTKTRHIIYPIGLHMLANLFGTLPTTLYYVEYGASTDSTIDLEAMFSGEITLTYVLFILKIALILFGIVMFFFSFFIKKYRWSNLCDIEIPKSKLLRVVIFNNGTMLFFIYSVFAIVLAFLQTGQ